MSYSRSGRNHPDAMDLWLESQGYCRKPVARDGSCLFRAFSEQMYRTQYFHLDVRKQCVNYLKEHVQLFEGHDIDGGIDSYLNLLSIPTQWGGMLEIKAMSELYQVDVLLFQEVGICAQNVTNRSFGKSVMLCLSPDQQYDSVYSKEFTKTASFCQSLVYEILYKEVFRMKDVDFAVNQMLHQKAPKHRGEFGGFVQRKLFSFAGNSLLLQRRGVSLRNLIDNNDDEVNVKDLLSKGITPFPYKVAKSLDPNVYRNVELDVWIDFRRGLRYFASHNELRVGVKCFVKIDNCSYVGHIQEMEPNSGPVLVFVEELGEKRTVPYESLELMPEELQVVKPIPLLSCGNQRVVNNFPKTTAAALSQQDSSRIIGFVGSKFKKRRPSGDELQSTEIEGSSPDQRGFGSRKGQQQSNKSDTENNVSNMTVYDGEENVTSLAANFQNFSVDSFGNTIPAYEPYQLKTNMELASGVPLSTPTHVFVSSSQLGSPPILIPVSPRPEDIPAHWLQTNHPMDPLLMSASPPSGVAKRTSIVPDGGQTLGFSQTFPANDGLPSASFSSSASDQVNITVQEPLNFQDNLDKENSTASNVDIINSNYMFDANANLLNGQINFNAPKSVLENGADLPMSDIQTLRFFYNLGNEVGDVSAKPLISEHSCDMMHLPHPHFHSQVYHAQYGMYGYGGFAQGYNPPCASSTPSPAGSPGMCPGKFCSCGPVCITTVPTIHHLLEPSTPPPNINNRRRYRDSVIGSPSGSPSSESTNSPPSTRATHSSSTPSSTFRMNKKDSKGKGKKDVKVFQGQPLHQSSPLGMPSSQTSNSVSQNSSEEERGSQSMQENDSLLSAESSGNSLSVPFPPPPSYSYVYCPGSPGVSFSPMETDTYFTPLRLQCPRDYLPDTPQSPPCFSVSGDLYSNPVSLFPSSPHYLYPASPGIYVGSPPWTPVTPPPPPSTQ